MNTPNNTMPETVTGQNTGHPRNFIPGDSHV